MFLCDPTPFDLPEREVARYEGTWDVYADDVQIGTVMVRKTFVTFRDGASNTRWLRLLRHEHRVGSVCYRTLRLADSRYPLKYWVPQLLTDGTVRWLGCVFPCRDGHFPEWSRTDPDVGGWLIWRPRHDSSPRMACTMPAA